MIGIRRKYSEKKTIFFIICLFVGLFGMLTIIGQMFSNKENNHFRKKIDFRKSLNGEQRSEEFRNFLKNQNHFISEIVSLPGGKCLDITDGNKDDLDLNSEPLLQIWDCANGMNQKFRFFNDSTIRPEMNHNFCIDARRTYDVYAVLVAPCERYAYLDPSVLLKASKWSVSEGKVCSVLPNASKIKNDLLSELNSVFMKPNEGGFEETQMVNKSVGLYCMGVENKNGGKVVARIFNEETKGGGKEYFEWHIK